MFEVKLELCPKTYFISEMFLLHSRFRHHVLQYQFKPEGVMQEHSWPLKFGHCSRVYSNASRTNLDLTSSLTQHYYIHCLLCNIASCWKINMTSRKINSLVAKHNSCQTYTFFCLASQTQTVRTESRADRLVSAWQKLCQIYMFSPSHWQNVMFSLSSVNLTGLTAVMHRRREMSASNWLQKHRPSSPHPSHFECTTKTTTFQVTRTQQGARSSEISWLWLM